MGMSMKTLRTTVAVFLLVLASAVPSSAQATVFVTGNTSFTVTWQGPAPGPQGATLLATATFTVSNWTGTSFMMTVTNVRNTMPTSPDINARLTAFGFGLTPEGRRQLHKCGWWNFLPMGVHEFPRVSKVDVCLSSGGGCAGRRGRRSRSR